MKKILFFAFILTATSVMEACNNGSNGDISRPGRNDTVGNQGNMRIKDSTNGLKDTLKHK
jgi:hypothetical protein